MIPVKICGITNLDDAEIALQAGTSAIGFIFYKKSPRYISVSQAQSIAGSLSQKVCKVGVFVNETLSVIQSAISQVPLDWIQLHGDESPEFCQSFSVPVIKAMRIKDQHSFNQLQRYDVNAFLFDTYHSNQYGGTGQAFDWSLLSQVSLHKPYILSGGLNPDNIIEALLHSAPAAVDINSGVEDKPGIKNKKKIEALFDQLKNTKSIGFQWK